MNYRLFFIELCFKQLPVDSLTSIYLNSPIYRFDFTFFLLSPSV